MNNSTALPRGMQLQWGWIFGSVIVAFAALMGLHYLYITFYSHVLHPDRDMAFLQQHVRRSGPWFAMLVGGPLLYALCRWVGQQLRADIQFNCLAIGILFVSLSTMLLVMSDDLGWRAQLAHASVLLGAYLGGRSARKQTAQDGE